MKLSKVRKISKKTILGSSNIANVYDIVLDKIHLFYARKIGKKTRNILIHNSLADIDVDFEAGTDDITDDFLYKKYGRNRVLNVSTFSTFSERNTLKDVMRAHFGKEATENGSDVDVVTKSMPNFDKVEYSLKDWFINYPKDPACSERVRVWLTRSSNKIILEQTLKLQLQVKGIGQHPAGIVITPGPCWEYLPVNMIAKQKSIVTAFQEADKSGKDLSDLQILKLDRLKIETLNVIKDAINLIKEKKNIDVSVALKNIDINDKNLFYELRLGMNHGIFQFESAGMGALIKGMSTETFEELIAANALYRPGPMSIKAHEEYIQNKFHPEDIEYVHPALKDILGKTNGVLVYQEQLMFLAHHIGGMSLGEGDQLRRYMDKASSAIMKKSAGEILNKKEEDNYKEFEKYWNKFSDGAAKQGYKKEEVDVIKDYVIKYLGYSFNRCLSKKHTVVSQTRGEIKILDVSIGEKVLGYNSKTGMNEFNSVKDIHENGKKKVYRAKTSNGKFLECTLDHKILTSCGMRTLQEILEKKLKIITNSIESVGEAEEIGYIKTYDLEIDSEDHNYYANGICVSNSHSCAYAYLAMRTLYLKHYYTTEFYTALFNHPKDSGDKDKVRTWIAAAISSAMSQGIKILPPSIKSGWDWTMTDDKEISMGFSGINGLGEIAYGELTKFLQKTNKTLDVIAVSEFFSLPFSKFNKSSFAACIKAGVFDSWSDSRQFLISLKEKKSKKKIAANQISIFDMGSEEFEINTIDHDYPKTTEEERQSGFLEVCNFDLKKLEKISKIKDKVNSVSKIPLENLVNFENNGWYYFLLEDVEESIAKTGTKYLTLKVGDGISNTKLRVFSPLADKIRPMLQPGQVYVSKFEKNKDGFVNFIRNAQIKNVEI